MTAKHHLLSALLTVAVIAVAGGAWGQEYQVRDLLEPCVEGDNDSRGGAVLELECEQYVSGFTDLFVRSGLAEEHNVCLPQQNRADEIRWAFMRWAHEHFGQRDMPAVDGLIATLKSHFKCK